MIVSQFDDLRREKGLREKRDLSVKKVSEETELSYNTLQRLRSGDMTRVYLSTLDRLCAYFQVKSIADLIEYKVEVEKQEGGNDAE